MWWSCAADCRIRAFLSAAMSSGRGSGLDGMSVMTTARSTDVQKWTGPAVQATALVKHYGSGEAGRGGGLTVAAGGGVGLLPPPRGGRAAAGERLITPPSGPARAAPGAVRDGRPPAGQ